MRVSAARVGKSRCTSGSTKRKPYTPEQIVRKPREGEQLLAEDKSIAEIRQRLGVAELVFSHCTS